MGTVLLWGRLGKSPGVTVGLGLATLRVRGLATMAEGLDPVGY
jgi:hypothetical protein